MTDAYPLAWPIEKPRTRERKRARFSTKKMHKYQQSISVAEATSRLRRELGLMQVRAFVLSTNVELRRDGLPYSTKKAPEDPGAAVYFKIDGTPFCLPCDSWDRVADNIAAIAATIGAKRALKRWGVGEVAEHFAGFKALPPKQGWREILALGAQFSEEEIVQNYRAKAKKLHPDVSKLPPEEAQRRMAELSDARDIAFSVTRGRK